ncbi:Bug family tripartite tricarboxylate transporter substrate binding protein [Bradyrhizobium zhanjiangense]|uniref:Bug family tripartite tricarboxylate transporter substrate binding protein n=1 Tax=Bradyrhizobium zhanjiangense TaxID=1325107 RepID=UPI001ABF69E9|nr:tripartite tricarboxylate transporter substrate-binding protein [Bradyrhizobium zhanjiangense]
MRIIVGFAPGGPVDSVARILADQLGKELGRTVIVENKSGANGAIAAQEVIRSAPDGGTIWITSVGAAAINQSLYDKLVYDMARDFAPVSLVVNNVEVLVINPNDSAKDAADFVASAKRAKETAMASSGVGSIPHLAIEQLAGSTGAAFLHVPYKGAAPAISDVMGGQVAGFFGDVPGLIGHVRGGKLRAIGVAAPKRHPALPDVKTFEEQGFKGIDTNNWYAIFVSSKTPPAVVETLNKAVRASLSAPDVNAKLTALGAEPAPSTPEELAALLKTDTEKWAALIKAKNIRGE